MRIIQLDTLSPNHNKTVSLRREILAQEKPAPTSASLATPLELILQKAAEIIQIVIIHARVADGLEGALGITQVDRPTVSLPSRSRQRGRALCAAIVGASAAAGRAGGRGNGGWKIANFMGYRRGRVVIRHVDNLPQIPLIDTVFFNHFCVGCVFLFANESGLTLAIVFRCIHIYNLFVRLSNK
jgi:hypothetical protein